MTEKDEKDLKDGRWLGEQTGGDAAESDTPQTETEPQVDPPIRPGDVTGVIQSGNEPPEEDEGEDGEGG